jgi:hypothetical protein
MGILGQAVFRLCERACRTDSACCRTTVGGKLNGILATRCQNMYAISLPKHVVLLSKSEGPQKWLAPCGTDVHRVSRTIDACILEKESHRQNEMIM